MINDERLLSSIVGHVWTNDCQSEYHPCNCHGFECNKSLIWPRDLLFLSREYNSSVVYIIAVLCCTVIWYVVRMTYYIFILRVSTSCRSFDDQIRQDNSRYYMTYLLRWLLANAPHLLYTSFLIHFAFVLRCTFCIRHSSYVFNMQFFILSSLLILTSFSILLGISWLVGTIATNANLQCLSSGSSSVAYVAGGWKIRTLLQ